MIDNHEGLDGPTPPGSAAAMLAGAIAEDLNDGNIRLTFPNGVRLLMCVVGDVAQLSREGMRVYMLEESDGGWDVEVEFRDR